MGNATWPLLLPHDDSADAKGSRATRACPDRRRAPLLTIVHCRSAATPPFAAQVMTEARLCKEDRAVGWTLLEMCHTMLKSCETEAELFASHESLVRSIRGQTATAAEKYKQGYRYTKGGVAKRRRRRKRQPGATEASTTKASTKASRVGRSNGKKGKGGGARGPPFRSCGLDAVARLRNTGGCDRPFAACGKGQGRSLRCGADVLSASSQIAGTNNHLRGSPRAGNKAGTNIHPRGPRRAGNKAGLRAWHPIAQ